VRDPAVATIAIRSGTASQARRSASPSAQARVSGVSGGPWQLMLSGIDRDVVARRQEMQRHHDAVIELPLFRVCEVDFAQHRSDQPARQLRVPLDASARDRQPFFVLDRPVVVLRHAHRECGHVVHEEIGEMLGGDDHQRIGPLGLDCFAHAREVSVERVAHARLGALGAPGDPRSMAAHAR
jgi:hypothetical protein